MRRSRSPRVFASASSSPPTGGAWPIVARILATDRRCKRAASSVATRPTGDERGGGAADDEHGGEGGIGGVLQRVAPEEPLVADRRRGVDEHRREAPPSAAVPATALLCTSQAMHSAANTAARTIVDHDCSRAEPAGELRLRAHLEQVDRAVRPAVRVEVRVPDEHHRDPAHADEEVRRDRPARRPAAAAGGWPRRGRGGPVPGTRSSPPASRGCGATAGPPCHPSHTGANQTRPATIASAPRRDRRPAATVDAPEVSNASPASPKHHASATDWPA